LKEIVPLKSTIVMDIGGREVRIDNDLVQKEFKVGYAATVHKYQGAEREEVIYILENSANMQGNAFYAQKELKYVGLSRATKKLDILALVEGTTGVHKPSSMKVHVNPTKPTRMMF
jgi:ATP-dependent exoDNAse (exonuclease V) alpha subunit